MCGVCGARARTLGADAGTIIEFELAACKTLASKGCKADTNNHKTEPYETSHRSQKCSSNPIAQQRWQNASWWRPACRS